MLAAGEDFRWGPPAMPDPTIHAAGEIVKKLGPTLYRAELPNGKWVMAHLSKSLTEAAAEFDTGDQVRLEFTAFDFDQARILCLLAKDAKVADRP